MITSRNLSQAWLLFLALFTTAGSAAEPMTWPRFDGPEYNRVSRERLIDLSWNDAQPVNGETIELVPVANEDSDRPNLWEIENLPGEQAPLVFNDKLYLLHQERTAPQQSEPENNNDLDSPETPASDETIESTAETSPAVPARYAIDCWLVLGRDQQARFRYRLPESTFATDSSRPFPQPQMAGDPLWRQLFCLAGDGSLHVLDSDLGSSLWSIDLPRLLGKTDAPVAVAAPLIFEHLVIASLSWEASSGAENEQAETVLIALDRRNGQVHWMQRSTTKDSGLNGPAPVLCVLKGSVAVVSQQNVGELMFVQANTGKRLATLPLANRGGLASEVLFESGRLAILESTGPAGQAPQWTVSVHQLHETEPSSETQQDLPQLLMRTELGEHEDVTALLRGSTVFAATSSGVLRLLSMVPETSERDLPLSSVGQHEMVWIDGQLLITGQAGHWQVYSFTPETDDTSAKPKAVYVELWEQPLLGPAVVAKQRVFVRVGNQLVALGAFDEQKAVSDLLVPFGDRAQKLNESREEEDQNAPETREPSRTTQILLVPAIQDLRAGFEIPFLVLGYDTQGQFTETIPPAEVDWSWEGPGTIAGESGVLTAPPSVEAAESATLQVRWKDQKAKAPVRLVPRDAPF